MSRDDRDDAEKKIMEAGLGFPEDTNLDSKNDLKEVVVAPATTATPMTIGSATEEGTVEPQDLDQSTATATPMPTGSATGEVIFDDDDDLPLPDDNAQMPAATAAVEEALPSTAVAPMPTAAEANPTVTEVPPTAKPTLAKRFEFAAPPPVVEPTTTSTLATAAPMPTAAAAEVVDRAVTEGTSPAAAPMPTAAEVVDRAVTEGTGELQALDQSTATATPMPTGYVTEEVSFDDDLPLPDDNAHRPAAEANPTVTVEEVAELGTATSTTFTPSTVLTPAAAEFNEVDMDHDTGGDIDQSSPSPSRASSRGPTKTIKVKVGLDEEPIEIEVAEGTHPLSSNVPEGEEAGISASSGESPCEALERVQNLKDELADLKSELEGTTDLDVRNEIEQTIATVKAELAEATLAYLEAVNSNRETIPGETRSDNPNIREYKEDGKVVVTQERDPSTNEVWYKVADGEGPRTIRVPRIDEKTGKPTDVCDILQYNEAGVLVDAIIADEPGTKSQINQEKLKGVLAQKEAARAAERETPIEEEREINAPVSSKMDSPDKELSREATSPSLASTEAQSLAAARLDAANTEYGAALGGATDTQGATAAAAAGAKADVAAAKVEAFTPVIQEQHPSIAIPTKQSEAAMTSLAGNLPGAVPEAATPAPTASIDRTPKHRQAQDMRDMDALPSLDSPTTSHVVSHAPATKPYVSTIPTYKPKLDRDAHLRSSGDLAVPQVKQMAAAIKASTAPLEVSRGTALPNGPSSAVTASRPQSVTRPASVSRS